MNQNNMMSNSAFRMLMDKADELLQNHLQECNEGDDFKKFRKWIINSVVDPHNMKLPSDCAIGYYNYCVQNFNQN
jgi:hypothetical protein